jgi:serine protease Do
LISQLAPGGPAQKSGLKAGDVIIEFDGKRVEDSAHLPHIVGLMEPGTSVPVRIVRDRKEKTVEVEVGGLDADDSYALSNRQADNSYGGRLGLITEGVPDEIQERLGINGGVVVRKVVSGSAAAEAGIVPGDVITYLGSAPISSTDALQEAVNDLKPGVSVPVRLIRRGSPLFIGLRLDE